MGESLLRTHRSPGRDRRAPSRDQHTTDAASHEKRRPLASLGMPRALAFIAFFTSGAAGLVYEIVWTRYLALFLGHSASAQVLVLMIFLGGTAAGALAVGALTHLVRRPLLCYAVAEVAIGIFGIAFHSLYSAITGLAYASVFPALGDGAMLLLAKWGISAALILPPSVLLGTTFPLMSAALLRRDDRAPGRLLAALYGANGLGGAVGALVAGFVLVGAFGLPGSLVAAGATSIAAALLVAAAAASHRFAERAAPRGQAALKRVDSSDEKEPDGVPALRPVLLIVAFGTAAASLAYEIAWTRMLSLLLGSATHSFELMLSAFILGLSAGAYWLRRRDERFAEPLRALGVIQWIMGALALASFPLFLASFRWTAQLLAALGVSPQGYALFNVTRYGLCLAVMLPATFCAGMTLPLITRLLMRTEAGEAAVGLVYGVNTIGSIVGVAAAGIFLLPVVGIKGLVAGAALLDMSLGVWLLAVHRRQRGVAGRPIPGWALAGIASAVLFWAGLAIPLDRELISSGVYRTRRLPPPGSKRVLFHRDGRTATVTGVLRLPNTLMLATNGKVDASLDDWWLKPRPAGAARQQLGSDAGTQTLLPLLGLAHVPGAKRAAVIGHGSGMTSHLLLGSPTLTSVTTIEIEREMILGSNVFYPANRRVFEDPRSHFAIEDARAYFAAQSQRFDLIVSEPSNPWVSGVSSLFTTEFYRLASKQLSPDGIFVQWVQLYEMTDELLLHVLAALRQSFPSFGVFYSASGDLVIVASRRASLPAPDWSVVQLPGIAEDLRPIVPLTAQTLEALRLGSEVTFAPLLATVAPNSDYFPVLDLGAERARYLYQVANEFMAFTGHRFDPFAALERRRVPIGTEPETAMEEIERPIAAALSARMRLWADRARDTLPEDARFAGAQVRKRMHDSFLAARVAPPDWQAWMKTVILVERDIHGTSAGAADERFYGSLFDFLRATAAPAGAVAAAHFMHGLASWDFVEAAKASEVLLSEAQVGRTWLGADLVREGTVVSKLLTGDVKGARRAYDSLTPENGGTDLRWRLLDAHLRAAEGGTLRAAR